MYALYGDSMFDEYAAHVMVVNNVSYYWSISWDMAGWLKAIQLPINKL